MYVCMSENTMMQNVRRMYIIIIIQVIHKIVCIYECRYHEAECNEYVYYTGYP